jgi:hypothetical protein
MACPPEGRTLEELDKMVTERRAERQARSVVALVAVLFAPTLAGRKLLEGSWEKVLILTSA